MKLTDNFENIGFHDAVIEKIERYGESIKLEISGAFISKDHPASDGQDWRVEKAILEICGVKNEKATFWDDTQVAKEHPEPDFPLDEIMHANFVDGVFSFDGFRQTIPWYEWFITANSFIFEVRIASEHIG